MAPFKKRAAQRNPNTACELQPDNATAATIPAGPHNAVKSYELLINILELNINRILSTI